MDKQQNQEEEKSIYYTLYFMYLLDLGWIVSCVIYV